MLVIVSRDASFKLDSSMFVVDGSYESGYVYNEDIFIIEGVNGLNDWQPVGADCLLFSYPLKTETPKPPYVVTEAMKEILAIYTAEYMILYLAKYTAEYMVLYPAADSHQND